MPYTKPDQAAFSEAGPEELVVQLDSGELVAVRAIGEVDQNTGNAVIKARARAVQADGSPLLDANGHITQSEYAFSADPAGVDAMGGMTAFQKLMLLTVLGENPQWPSPPASDILEHASIRTNLAAAAHAGPVMGIAALL